METNVMLTLRVPQGLAIKARVIAAQRNLSRSELVRELLEQHIQATERQRQCTQS